MTFRLPESLRRIVEEAPHDTTCAISAWTEEWAENLMIALRGVVQTPKPDCNCWLSRFWAEVARLEKEKK